MSALAAIWFGGPLSGVPVLATEWARLAGMAGTFAVFAIFVMIGRIRRQVKSRAIERALMRDGRADDSKVFADRMSEALQQLKKTHGKHYLYDLPWYVIIGPPGAGKTTALVNSGLRFPVSGAASGALDGFGGTRYCDWWFAEDAVLIDTAGRYTTQDSDIDADGTSWRGFLTLLRKSRPKQPVNGVIVAFSVEDMMRSSSEALTKHADTVRARLLEMQSDLKVNLPVYVLFTKADLIAGFREFYNDYNQEKRAETWGVTFPTKDRKARTVDNVAPEFDRLLTHLSTGLIDQMQPEADEAARIAMFNLPGQMAHLRAPIVSFLTEIFGPMTPKSRISLRGFYFASGTQEGTPFDQALGAIQRLGDGGSGAGMAFSPGFMSGKGKSFFLHDLLKKVIFAERHWVGYSRGAMIRTAILRSLIMTVLMIATLGVGGVLGYSYWQNATLLQQTREQISAYQIAAASETGRTLISDPDLRPVLPLLNDMRALVIGLEPTGPQTVLDEIGLAQGARVEAAARQAYSDALEQMLRPRMILSLENQFPFWDQAGALAEIFQGLKVYMLLGGQGARTDDVAITEYFDRAWSQGYGHTATEHAALIGHLQAMLALDDSRALLVGIQADTVSLARTALSRATLANVAYALVRHEADVKALPEWSALESAQGFLVTKNEAVAATVPGVFTAAGFQNHVVPTLNAVGDRLREDQWVLGLSGAGAALQTSALAPRVQDLYAADFTRHWQQALSAITLAPMTKDGPTYERLARLASYESSPLLLLIEDVAGQTTLMRSLPQIEDQFAPWVAAVSGGVGTRPIDEILAHLTAAYRSLNTGQPTDPDAVAAALDPIGSLRVLLPDTVDRLVGDAEAQIRRHAIPPNLERMRSILAEQITQVCADRLTPYFPLTPSDQSVPMEDFAAFFGPSGAMDRYFSEFLRPHVETGSPRLRPHPDSPIAALLSPEFLAQFDRAAEIRAAFFPAGPTPRVDLVISHVDSTADVATARLVINDMLIETVKGDVPVIVQWPGPGTGVRLELQPEIAEESNSVAFEGSAWDVMRLLQNANSRAVQAERIRASFVLGPRQITYELRSRTAPHPFALRALSQFECPTGLE